MHIWETVGQCDRRSHARSAPGTSTALHHVLGTSYLVRSLSTVPSAIVLMRLAEENTDDASDSPLVLQCSALGFNHGQLLN